MLQPTSRYRRKHLEYPLPVLKLCGYLLLLMAYGPETGGFIMTVAAKLLVGGGSKPKKPNHVNLHLILRAAAPGTVVVIAIDCFPTLPAPEGSRWRSFTPVERV